MISKFYLLLTPLPPDTTTLAVLKSGLLVSVESSLTKLVLTYLGTSASSTEGEPSCSWTSSKLAGLKVRKLSS